VKENSTVTYSVGGLILSNSGAITANYWLSEIYDEEIANAHRNCDMHIHDLSMLTGYCAGWSLKQLIKEGLGGVPGKITSSPASHLSTLCNQMVNFLGIMQNEWAGAQAFSSFDTYLAPFVKIDNLSQKEVKQCVQSFVYGVNTPSRWGTQAPFSNITLDWTCPTTWPTCPPSWAARRWTSPTATARRKWTW
jgi:ribonucleoside-triphosphate reductase